MDSVLLALAVGFLFWCIGQGIVGIIRASKGSDGNKVLQRRLETLEADLINVEQDLEDANKRIQVLERIVTDDRHDLRRQIDELG